jgi:hypothetical protein
VGVLSALTFDAPPTSPRDYFNVVDYQERVDRFRARLKQLAELQLRFQFFMPQQSEQINPKNDDLDLHVKLVF